MNPPLPRAGMVVFFVAAVACGQNPPTRQAQTTAPPLLLPTQGTAATFAEKPWDQLSDKELGDWGKKALRNPKSWRHGETKNLIIHFQKLAQAQKAAREGEFYYEFLKSDLGLETDYRKGKSHLFVFGDSADWDGFLQAVNPGRWISTTMGTEMFICARSTDQNFSQHLAWPITSCVLYRYFPKRLPFWLLTGVDQFETGNAYKEMKGISGGARGSGRSGTALYPLEELFAAKGYPEKNRDDFRATAERIVRVLLTKLDRKRFVPLGLKLGEGMKFQQAVVEVYPEKFKTFQDFMLLYGSFR